MTPDAVKYETVHHGDGHVTMPGLGVQTRTWVPDEGWPETDDRPIDWSKVFMPRLVDSFITSLSLWISPSRM
jgi:hypothetical protein